MHYLRKTGKVQAIYHDHRAARNKISEKELVLRHFQPGLKFVETFINLFAQVSWK
jgi:hypothetical protein